MGSVSIIGGPGEGGGRRISWKTFGSSDDDDYSTASEAISDGEYSLIMTSSVTETVGVAALPDVDVNIIFESPSFTLTFADGIQIVSTSYSSFFNIFVNGGTIAWGNTSSGTSPFDFIGNNAVFNLFGGGNLINTSTAATTPVAEAACIQGYYGQFRVTAANVNQGGIACSSRAFYAENLKFTGGGTSCYYALNISSPTSSKIGVLEFHGAFSQASSFPCYAVPFNCPIDSLYMNMSNGAEPIELYGPITCYKQQNTNTVGFYTGAQVQQAYRANSSATVTIDSLRNGNYVYNDVNSQGKLNWSISDKKYVYETLSTSDATQTEIVVHDGQRLDVFSNWTAHCNIRVLCMRNNQDWAVFQLTNVVIANDGGVYTITNGVTSESPAYSKGTGSTLTLDVDASSGLRIRITANASEFWDHKAEVDFITQNN